MTTVAPQRPTRKKQQPTRPPEFPAEALPKAAFAMLRAAFSPQPPDDLLDRAKQFLRDVRVNEGKLGEREWSARLDQALEAVRAAVPPERREAAFRDYRHAFRVRGSAAHQAAHATALTLYAQERETGRHTTLWQCLQAAFAACRLPEEERHL